jgi:hypothetical protein
VEKLIEKYPKQKTIEFELARFFLALNKAMNIPQLLPYLKKQIFENTEKNYQTLTDEEVDSWLNRD